LYCPKKKINEIEFVVKMLHNNYKTRRPYAALLLLFTVLMLYIYRIIGLFYDLIYVSILFKK